KNEIILYKIRENKKIKYFFVDDFSYKLKEGTAKIIISAKGAKAAEYEFIVLWKNKPKTLMNPEFAIKLLTIIESEKKIDTLLSTDKKDYFNVLNKYWEKKNPDKKTAFNEIEYEFYKRADYAMKNFSTVSNPVGAKSDRGKIYIRYGEPDEIIREYSDSNSVIEVWKYKQLKREFVFTDKTGLGNYSLD
ncbi:MAG: GWxTD domain-containing protein, partial [Bacteroidota bacterium]